MINKNILIVDDNFNMRESLITAFDNEYMVWGVGEGREAIEIIRKESIDVVILEIKLPDIDGIEVLEQIKKLNETIIVILMTDYGSKEILIRALYLKADGYFDKPFDINEIKRRIRDLLKLRENPYYFKGYPLDVQERVNRVNKVKRLVKINNGKSKLYEIAKEICLSPKYLSRIFKVNNDKKFTQYRTDIKINCAKQLLRDTTLSISEIGYTIGYTYPSGFTRAFRKLVGSTPIQYRKR